MPTEFMAKRKVKYWPDHQPGQNIVLSLKQIPLTQTHPGIDLRMGT